MSTDKSADDTFRVPGWVDALSGFMTRRRDLWIRLGQFETRMLSDELADILIDRPIYISGLARSGSTILLEILAKQEGLVTHRYKDYPPVFTPYLWNRFLEHVPQRKTEAAERTHRDGIQVTPDSPEAFEEILWMAFFPELHTPGASDVLDERSENPAFETFYRDHIRKLLRVRGGGRYLSKANYNVTRLEYLLKMFPDARFILPVREPVWHIASLMKQHALFCEGERRSPRALEHMRRVGHFEFGLDRRPINLGNAARAAEIAALWERGNEVEGWALCWSDVYGHVADRLEANPRLRDATLLVRYEELCRTPRERLLAVAAHCRLEGAEALADRAAETIRFPTYYKPRFSGEELDMIGRLTRATAERLGYRTGAAASV